VSYQYNDILIGLVRRRSEALLGAAEKVVDWKAHSTDMDVRRT
jgi:hypothetical protein